MKKEFKRQVTVYGDYFKKFKRTLGRQTINKISYLRPTRSPSRAYPACLRYGWKTRETSTGSSAVWMKET